MKKTLLSLIIASLLATACSEDKAADTQKAVENTTEQAVQKVEKAADNVANTVKEEVKKVVTDANPADGAENAFNALNEATQAYYTKFLSTQPMLESFKYEQVSYDKGADTSKAVTKAIVTLRQEIEGKKQYDLVFNHDIQHDTALLDQGIVTKVVSKIAMPEGADVVFAPLFENFSYETEVKTDDSLVQVATLKPVVLEKSGEPEKFDLKGFTITTKSTLGDLKNGFGEFTGKVEPIQFIEGEEVTGNLSAFDLKGFYKENHEYDFSTSAIAFTSPDANVNVESISSNGTYELKDELGIAVGKQAGTIRNIEITSGDLPTPIKLKQVDFESNTDLDSDNIISASASTKVVPEGDAFKMLTQGMLNVKEANIGFAMNNVPAAVMKQYQELMGEAFEKAESEGDEALQANLKEKGKAILEQLKAQGADMAFNLDVNADEGTILLNTKANLLKDSTVSFEQLEEMEDPSVIFQLLNVNADASVPAALVEAIAGPNIMMVGMFMQKEGDVYKSTVTTENGKLMINGVPAPF